MTTPIQDLKKDLYQLEDQKEAEKFKRFFKTSQNEYAYNDKFLGIKSKKLQELAKKYINLSLDELSVIIKSPFHEERKLALTILISKYKKSKSKSDIYNFYIENIKHVNNWDLVDMSAPYLLGNYLFKRDKSLLHKFAKNKSLWIRRISIISTLYFIKQNEFTHTLSICKILLNDKEDLIHKAIGWMLREVGEHNLKEEERFLIENYSKIPRTALRYAIEKFEKNKRLDFLKNKLDLYS